MGYTSRKIGNFEKAEKFYLTGLSIKPDHNGINEYLGELYVQTNRIDKANERLEVLKNCNCEEFQELELIRESGFHPLEVIRSATLNAAEALGMEKEIGTVEVGKYADMILMEENPLKNLKYLYGTGDIKINENNEAIRVGGIKYTIKDGIIFDSRQLLEDAKKIVDEEKAVTPGWEKYFMDNVERE